MQQKIADIFIPDIFELISYYLTQFELISLSKTCVQLNGLSTCLLYRSITIDSGFSQFENEYLFKSTTFIRTKANFLLLIKSLNKNHNHLNLWQLIKELKVMDLPLDFYDFESYLLGLNTDMNNGSISFFLKSRLSTLRLQSPVGFNVLKHLLNDQYSRENLSVLNFTINGHAAVKPLDSIIENQSLKFQNLNTFSIGPLKQNCNFQYILELIDRNSIGKLQNFGIEYQHKTFRLLDLLDGSETKLKTSNYIFKFLSPFESLKSLSLKSVNFNQNLLIGENGDTENFRFFQNLSYIELSDIGVISSNDSQSLLHTFYRFTDQCKLKYIKLDIRSTSDDFIPEFFNERVPNNQLREIDVIIRHNALHVLPLDRLIDKYIKLLVLNQRKSLEKLSLEVKSEKNLMKLEEQLQKEHLVELMSYQFSELKSLRLQVHFENILLLKNQLFRNMGSLEKIWIVGSNAVPVHFGLGNMYPGIYDNWWRIIYLPKALVEETSDHPIHYIKIDECLFVVNQEETEIVQPKDSMDELFNRMTRVSFNNIC